MKRWGKKCPYFAHLPMILGPDGSKLSKRQGATSVKEYQKKGYLPDALCNYLMRLGWASGDKEIMSREEMIALFTLEGVGSKGSIFDQAKLNWVNSVYIKAASAEYLLAAIKTQMDPHFLEKCKEWDESLVLRLIAIYKDRVKTLEELAYEIVALYEGPPTYSAEGLALLTPEIKSFLTELIKVLHSEPFQDATQAQKLIKHTMKNQFSMAQIAPVIRFALLGQVTSPGIFELMSVLGSKKVVERLQRYRALIS